MINENWKTITVSILSAFWPDDLDVYMLQFPPQCGTCHHWWMLKATSCGRKCAANIPAYYDVTGIYRHIPPGHANKRFPRFLGFSFYSIRIRCLCWLSHKIPLKLQATRLGGKIIALLWNLTGILAVLLPWCLSNCSTLAQLKTGHVSLLWDFTRYYDIVSISE